MRTSTRLVAAVLFVVGFLILLTELLLPEITDGSVFRAIKDVWMVFVLAFAVVMLFISRRRGDTESESVGEDE